MFERRCKGGRPTDNRTRLPQEKMVGGGFTIALAIHSLDSTLQNSIALPVRSVDLAKLPLQKRRFNQIILMWGKGFLSGNTGHCTPLECRRGEASCSIDISLRRSENQTTKEHLFIACHRTKIECFLLNELYRQGYWHASKLHSTFHSIYYRGHYPFA